MGAERDAASTAELESAVDDQGRNINWFMAAAGGFAGAAVGTLVWWGFTVLTGIAFGLVAIVIGFAVGQGVLLLSGHKRHVGLQAMSAAISAAAFAYAAYLVNRTFIQQSSASDGTERLLPLAPAPELFVEVAGAGFGVMEIVFLAIVIYQAWRTPAPVSLPGTD